MLLSIGGARGIPMVPWDVCTMPKNEGGLGLIDIEFQNNILDSKWVIICLKGSFPCKILMRYRFRLDPHVGNIRGKFSFCDIIWVAHNFQIAGSFIFQSIWIAWNKLACLLHWRMSSNRVGWD